MKVSVDEVRRIAKLARLEFEPAEEAELSKDLTRILDYMDSLREVQIPDDFDPDTLANQYPAVSPREDTAARTLDREDALGAAQDVRGDYFTVPKVIRRK